MSEPRGVLEDGPLYKLLGSLLLEADHNMHMILAILRTSPELLHMDFYVPWGNEGAYNGTERVKRNFLCWVSGASKTTDVVLIECILNMLSHGARGHVLSHQTFAGYMTLSDGRFPQQATVSVDQAALLIDYGASIDTSFHPRSRYLDERFERRQRAVALRRSARIVFYTILRRHHKFSIPRDVAIYLCTEPEAWRGHLNWRHWSKELGGAGEVGERKRKMGSCSF